MVNILPDFNAVLEYVHNSTNNIGYLNLTYNDIGDEGAIALARELANNTTITSLDLSYNNIGDQKNIE